MIILDTNIVIYYLQGDSFVSDWLENSIAKGETFGLSTLSVVELLGYKKLPQTEKFVIQQLLQTIMIIDVDIIIAHTAAELRQQYNLRTVDSVIAATAKVLSARLVSRDRSFRRISSIQLLMI